MRSATGWRSSAQHAGQLERTTVPDIKRLTFQYMFINKQFSRASNDFFFSKTSLGKTDTFIHHRDEQQKHAMLAA